ncbi:hypothetical protein EIP86_000569 [Pleurotus ostreatoroseus]|nr:hypothetical protein EIP86_000569 [Pleurotus ostreatoroseus]
MTTYKRRSFSFPLYPYPRYRTPSSEDLTFTFDDDAHDKFIAENFVLADSPTPGEEFKFSAEPEIQNATVLAEKTRMPSPQTVKGLRPISESLRNIDREVERCEENMNTLLICSGLFFPSVLFLLSRLRALEQNSATSQWYSNLPAFAFWTAALILDAFVIRLCMSVKRQLKASELSGRPYCSLRDTFNVRLFRPRELTKIFQIANILPMALHVSLVLLLVGCGASFVTFTMANMANLFVAAAVLTTSVVYLFHATTIPSPLRYGVQVLAPAIVRVVLSLSSSLQNSYAARFGSIDLDTNEQVVEDDIAILDDEVTPCGDHVKLIITVDNILVDDDLFATSMVPVVQGNGSSLANVVYFAQKALEHRLPGLHFPREQKDSHGLLDLRGLEPRVWEAVVDLVAGLVARHLPAQDQTPRFISPWLKIAMSILFSHSDHLLTTQGKNVVAMLTSPPHIEFTCRHVVKRTQSLGNIWYAFSRVLPAQDECDHAHVLGHVLRARFCAQECMHGRESIAEWAAHTHAEARWHTGDTFDALASIVHRHVPCHPEATWHPPAEEVLLVMLRWAQKANSADEEENMSRPIFELLRRPEAIFTNSALSADVAIELLQFLSHCTIVQYELERSNVAERAAILKNITAVLERYASGKLDESASSIDVMRLARRPVWMLQQTANDSHKNWTEWQPLLCVLARALRTWKREEHDVGVANTASRTAGHCLEIIAQLTTRPTMGWTMHRLAVPTELLEVLHLFLRPNAFEGACERNEVARRCFGQRDRIAFDEKTMAHMTRCGLVSPDEEEEDEGVVEEFFTSLAARLEDRFSSD